MKRAGVFIVLVCGLLFGSTSFADNHKNKTPEARLDVDPKLGAALIAYEHRDFEKARVLLQPVAKRGEVQAQFILGRLHALGLGTKKDTNEAEKWYRKAAEQGHIRAQFRLAMLLDSKKIKRYGESLALLRKAAKQATRALNFGLRTNIRITTKLRIPLPCGDTGIEEQPIRVTAMPAWRSPNHIFSGF